MCDVGLMTKSIFDIQKELDTLSTEDQQKFIEHWLSQECGKLEFFDPTPWLQCADILAAGDEPLMALKLLELVPGFYRDHYPVLLQEKRAQIQAALTTPAWYVTNYHDTKVREELAVSTVEGTLRGVNILEDVKNFNIQGLIPHIIDLGPGEYWLPIGLQKLGCEFTYQPIGLCSEAHEKAIQIIGSRIQAKRAGRPEIFVACELIEHLHHEADIRSDCARARGNPDIIHISTPKYCFDGRAERINWSQFGELGHLRTYTPDEFRAAVLKMWPEYQWTYVDGQPMHMRGLRKAVG